MGLQSLRDTYINQGVPPEVAEVILQAQRPSTHRQYDSYLAHWFKYCSEHTVDPLRPPVGQVLTFMDNLRIQRTLGYNALNTVRSALSSIITMPDGTPFGQCRLVKLYMKGVFNMKPPTPRYIDTWDPARVLRHIKTWAPPITLTLKQLTFKVAMLILLVTGQRVQTLALLDITNMTVNVDSVVFRIFELLKQSRPGYRNPEIILRAFPRDNQLCVFTYLLEYLELDP